MIEGPDYVFIALPRTASVSITDWLRTCQHGEDVNNNEDYHSARIPQQSLAKTIFTVVRNPYDRMASLYRLVSQKFWPSVEVYETVQTIGMGLDEFVLWCIGRPNHKWRSQASILGEAQRWPDIILRYEELPFNLYRMFKTTDEHELLHSNKTKADTYILTSDDVAAINLHSAADFEMLAYARK